MKKEPSSTNPELIVDIHAPGLHSKIVWSEDVLKKYRLAGLVGLGVDRMEYTKALIKRLQAIHLFFDRYERLHGKVTFIQIAVSTRLRGPYLDYAETLGRSLSAREVCKGSGQPTGFTCFLFLDYDGTLTPIVESPEGARLQDSIHSLLLTLKEITPLAVISGRSLEDVKECVGIDGIIYAGNHGSEIWDGENTVISRGTAGNSDLLTQLLDAVREATESIEGVLVEDKGATAGVHFRKVRPKDLARFFDRFSKATKGFEQHFFLDKPLLFCHRLSPRKKTRIAEEVK